MSIITKVKSISRKLLLLVLVTAITLVAISTITTLGLSLSTAIGIVVFVWGAITLQGIRRIPANPPFVAEVTFLGKRTNTIKKEGFRFFLFRPWLYDYILVPITKINQDLPEEHVITPDRAKLSIPVSVTWTPDSSETLFENGGGERKVPLIFYLNNGGEAGVRNILQDIIRERVREWASSAAEGPQTWDEALRSRESATAVLLKTVLGEEIAPISSTVPTTILIKYLASPQGILLESEKKQWGEKWEKVEERIKEDEKNEPWQKAAAALGKTYSEMLADQVRARREEIRKARQGNGGFHIRQLGIILNRLNVGEIKPEGAVAETADRKAKELQEREGEILELEHVAKRIAEFQTMGFTLEAAKEIVMVERGKANLAISETKLNISPETRAMIEKIAPQLLSQLFGGLFGKGRS